MDHERKKCSFCGEFLAPTAYYCHISDRTGCVCPGKLGISPTCAVISESDDDLSLPSSLSNLDSSFDFGSVEDDDMEMGLPFSGINDHAPPCTTIPEKDESESSFNDVEQESGDEIWSSDEEYTENDSQQQDSSEGEKADDIMWGISLFWLFFQLTQSI